MVLLEDKYEAKRRKRALEETIDVKPERQLLPVKIGRTVKPSFLKRDIEPINPEVDELEKEPDLPLQPKSFVDLYAEQMQKASEKRRILAVAASKIMESPSSEIGRLKEMLAILDTIDVRCQAKLWMFAVGTLCELFKDILPSYHIRIATETEKKQKAKKETKELRLHEEQMLSAYKRYLSYLEKYLPKKMFALLKPYSVPQAASVQLCSFVVKCFGELLIIRPSFNFSQNILRVLVPLMNSGTIEISNAACYYVGTVFQTDKTQEIVLEAVRSICRYIKKREYSVRPEMIRTFLKIRIREVDFDAPAREREERRLKRLKFKLLSKKEQKRQKDLDKVNKQLEAAGAVENEKKKLALQTSIVEQLFSVYFFVLKSALASCSSGLATPLLSAVLEGMAIFSKFMSIDYYDDLFRTLGLLLETGKLTSHESLNCIRSAFKMMQGDGEALDVDPARFYRHLFILLVDGDFSRWPDDDFVAMLECLEFMLIKRRKHLSDERLFAFAKRIASAAVSCAPDSAHSLSLIVLLRSLFGIFPSLDRLLDPSPHRPGGIYRPDVDDPEHCSAEGSFLYELSLLQSSCCSALAQFALKFAQEYNSPELSSKTENAVHKHALKGTPVNLDAYCRMPPAEIFIRHSMQANLAAMDPDNTSTNTSKVNKKKNFQKPKLVSNLANRKLLNSFDPKMAPAMLKRKYGKRETQDSKDWNRKTRRAYKFGKNPNLSKAATAR